MFSLVLPVYNEASCLKSNLREVKDYLDSSDVEYEIIIAEDGSTDDSFEIGLDLSFEYDNVRVIHGETKRGRRALKKALSLARGEYIGYMDTDLATDLKHLEDLIKYVKEYDIAFGSRYVEGSNVERSFKRMIFSRLYNLLARLFFNSQVYDHQCGFKGFKKKVLNEICKFTESEHWFWDTEVLIIAQRLGYSMKEFPVTWHENRKSKVKITSDSVKMLLKLIKLRLALKL